MTYDNIKIKIEKKKAKQKTGSHSLSKKYIFGKTSGKCQTETPSLLRIKALI